MTKKVLLGILVSILLSLFTSFCFAATDTDNVNLGNDVSSSINKGMDSVGNVVRDVAGYGERTFDDMGNHNNNNNNNNRNNNGYTGSTNNGYNGYNGNYGTNYGTTRTGTEGTANATGSTGGMTTTTWMWVIFAIAAIIIIAAIWYYAMQGNDRS